MIPPDAVPPRLFLSGPLHAGPLELPAAAARHIQVLRLRPGADLALFDGDGGEWRARLLGAGRVELLDHAAVERELPQRVTLALGMPANDRMDWLVEKATELGAAALQPLVTRRSVLRLSGERAGRRVAHWRAIAIAACEQCGRNRVPEIAPVREFAAWLAQLDAPRPGSERRVLLSPDAAPGAAAAPLAAAESALVLSGPEGGLSEAEEVAARDAGFVAATLGPRVLRADTAPLAALLRLTSLETTR